MSITWWSASVVGTGTVRKDKERGVLRIGSCSEKIMFQTPVPEGCSVDAQAFSVFFLRAVVLPSSLLRVVYKAVLVAQAANRQRRSRDALHAKRYTWCQSGWSQCAFKHCLVTLYRDRGICSSKDACLFLLKRPPVAGVLESNAVSQHSVNETDAVVFLEHPL